MASKNQGYFSEFVRHKDICPLLKQLRPVWKETISAGRVIDMGENNKCYLHAFPASFRDDVLTFLRRRAGVENPEIDIPASEEEESEALRKHNADQLITAFQRAIALLHNSHRGGSAKTVAERYLGHLRK